MLALAKKKRMPDDPLEWAQWMTAQWLEAVPLLGPALSGALGGKYYQPRALGIDQVLLTGATVGRKLIDSEASTGQRLNASVRFMTETMKAFGLPAVGVKNIFDSLVNRDFEFAPDLWELFGGAPEEKE